MRGGVNNLLLVSDRLRGWHAVVVIAQRTRLDFARCVTELVDVHDPAAHKIVLIPDQRNTHSPASLDAAFPATEAKCLADRVENHQTPKHGSGLTMAELELSVLQRLCLRQRLGNGAALAREVSVWTDRRIAAMSAIDWQCATTAARVMLRRLYPSFDA